MIVNEKLRLDSIASNYYSCNLCKTDNDVIISFDNAKIIFKSCLIFKCGYPNEEIYIHYDYYTQGVMKKHCLYEIRESKWVKDLLVMNRVHSRHTNEIAKGEKHFMILFEDEVFECLAKSYEVNKGIN